MRKVREVEDRFSLLQGSVIEKDRWIENIIRLLSNQNSSDLPNKLLLDAIRHAPTTSRHDTGSLLEYSERLDDVDMEGTFESEMSRPTISVLSDDALLHHLMALYFTWVHPVHMLFSERHFMASFQASDSKYCSVSMINAICAVGCCYMTEEDGNDVDPKGLGQRLYQDARHAIRMEEGMSPVSAVSYAILFLYEMSQGQARNASSHLRLSIESLRQVGKDQWTEESFEISLWGIHALNTYVYLIKFGQNAKSFSSTWAAFTYQKPFAPMSPRAMVFKNVELDDPGAYWSPYRLAQHASSVGQPSYAIQTAKEFAKLNQIIHATINLYCGSRGRVTATAVLRIFQRYLHWKESLPDDLNPSLEVKDPLPHVIFLQ